MVRTLIEEILLFVLPFCVFAGYLIVRRRNPFRVEAWSGHLFWLSTLGLVLGIAFFIYSGLVAPRHKGAFVPPHVENGRLIQGQFDD
ncbi:DUF6111 family protein [Bosea sp. TWI1241]|jgi:hypothetical protein|uniref:DUF6111 family protein n=1 Tax=Bosea sp. TWI1241 TaxID=3148904 RepID=UPI00320B9EDF